MDMVRKLILERLQELDLNMAEVSAAIGRNPTYLHQFMKRGVPVELHERERLRLAEVLRLPEDQLRGPSSPLPKRNYEKKSRNSRENPVANDMQQNYTYVNSPDKIVPGADLFGARLDLPIFGTAQGGQDGALILSDRAVDWQARPAVLLRVLDGYGVIVSGDSMSPEHKAGSIALVNPHLPARVGDSCVFRGELPDGTRLALIKEYRGQTETHWKVRQHTPPKDYTLKKAEWQEVHRTVGNYAP